MRCRGIRAERRRTIHHSNAMAFSQKETLLRWSLGYQKRINRERSKRGKQPKSTELIINAQKLEKGFHPLMNRI